MPRGSKTSAWDGGEKSACNETGRIQLRNMSDNLSGLPQLKRMILLKISTLLMRQDDRHNPSAAMICLRRDFSRVLTGRLFTATANDFTGAPQNFLDCANHRLWSKYEMHRTTQ